MISVLNRVDSHARLIRRMAELTTGSDLGTAVERGRLSGEGFRSAVLACAVCRDADACVDWLDYHDSERPLPPTFCRNGSLLRRLAPAA
jgi:hypothetical protein